MEQLKTGIIGCGAIFPMHADPVSRNAQAKLACVCDVDIQKAAAAAKRYGCHAYSDYREMLAREQLDIVHICTPHYLHADMAVDALQAGCHVLCEKPMALTREDSRRMLRAAQDAGRRLGVVYQNRFNPGSLLIKRTLDSGALGKIHGARMQVYWHRDAAYYAQADWRGTWEQEGGGVIINQSIHTLDLMRWLIGEPVLDVQANLSNRMHPEIEVEDTAEGVIRFANGLNALFYATVNNCRDEDIELHLTCEKGIAVLRAARADIAFSDGHEPLCADNNPNEYYETHSGAKEYWGVSHLKLIDDFYRAVLTGTEPFVSAEEALRTQDMICALYEAGRTGLTAPGKEFCR